MSIVFHELIDRTTSLGGAKLALSDGSENLSYNQLRSKINSISNGFSEINLHRYDRVAIYLDKRIETVAVIFGICKAGGSFVPINPLLKSSQIEHILSDSGARVLVTDVNRLKRLSKLLPNIADLTYIIIVDGGNITDELARAIPPNVKLMAWEELLSATTRSYAAPQMLDTDMAAILYTSGSTGRAKGVVLSHRNLVVGAQSVVEYLEMSCHDTILSVLPLSFDAGLSQMTTTFAAGARLVLHNYLLPSDVVRACTKEKVTGLTGVPSLWIELARQNWPEEARQCLRFFANTGGHMPRVTLEKLRVIFATSKPYLMYGLTEAFRSTYLDPAELDRRSDSIGKAIPNAEILVINKNGDECVADEIGELVHRGPLVSMGYWNDPERTAERFRPAPFRPSEIPVEEMAVWSGDLVRRDEEGFHYFVGRNDEMIKTSGYRVSPTEIEEVVLASNIVSEVVAIGVPHPQLGQTIVIGVVANDEEPVDIVAIMQRCRHELPLYMVPSEVKILSKLPRNPNGKIDRVDLRREWSNLFFDGE